MITELQQLVVRLVGDGTSYKKMLDDANKETEEASERVEQLGTAAAGFLGALGIQDFLQEAKGEWMGAETAMFKLTSVLKANHEEVEDLADEYAEFATALQAVTTASDESILGIAKMAESFELTGKAAQRATKDAMALAAVNDGSAESALRLTAAMEKGDTERAMMYARMIPQLRGVKDEAEFTEKYYKLIAAGQITLQDEVGTVAGRAANFANQWSDALEGIGKAYTDVANPIKIAKKTVMELWGTMGEGAQTTSVHIVGWATNITMAVTAVTALNALLPGLKGNLLAVAKNPFLWAAAATVGIAALTKEMLSQTQAAKDLAKEMENLERASKGYRESIATSTDEGIKAADGERAKLEELLESRRKGLQMAQAAEEVARKNLYPEAALGGAGGGRATRTRVGMLAGNVSKAVGGPETPEIERLRGLYAEAKKESAAWADALDRVNDEIEKLGKQRNAAAIERHIEDARKAAEQAGKDADQIAREDLDKKGARQEQIDELERLQNKRKLREQLLALDKEARYAGLNENQKAVAMAEDAGASKQQVERIKGAQKRIELQETLRKTLDDLKTPEQKLTEETEKLNQLYREGQLTADQYAQANQKLRDSILGVAAAEQAAMKFGGSQDMVARRQYFDALSLSPGAAAPPRPDFNALAKDRNNQAVADNNALLKEVLQKLRDAGVFNLAFVGGAG